MNRSFSVIAVLFAPFLMVVGCGRPAAPGNLSSDSWFDEDFIKKLPSFTPKGATSSDVGRLECDGEPYQVWTGPDRGAPSARFTSEGVPLAVFTGVNGTAHSGCAPTVTLACKIHPVFLSGEGAMHAISEKTCCANPHVAAFPTTPARSANR